MTESFGLTSNTVFQSGIDWIAMLLTFASFYFLGSHKKSGFWNQIKHRLVHFWHCGGKYRHNFYQYYFIYFKYSRLPKMEKI